MPKSLENGDLSKHSWPRELCRTTLSFGPYYVPLCFWAQSLSHNPNVFSLIPRHFPNIIIHCSMKVFDKTLGKLEETRDVVRNVVNDVFDYDIILCRRAKNCPTLNLVSHTVKVIEKDLFLVPTHRHGEPLIIIASIDKPHSDHVSNAFSNFLTFFFQKNSLDLS